MFGLFVFRCEVCGNPIRRRKYRWRIEDHKVWVCPACNSTLERQKSRQAFDPDAKIKLPNLDHRSPRGDWRPAVVAIIVVVLVSSIASNLMGPVAKPDLAQSPPTATPSIPAAAATPPVLAPDSVALERGSPAQPTPAPQFTSAEDAQQEAVRRYPDLGVKGSKLNTEFVARYKLYQQQRPEYFRDPSWPMHLAEELASSPQSK